MSESMNADVWRNVKANDLLILTDEQSIHEGMRQGRGAEGMDYVVKGITIVKELNDLCEWRLLQLDSKEEDTLMLMVKIVDCEVDLRLYFSPTSEDFLPGDRIDQIEAERFYLFEEPEDIDDFEPTDLVFTKTIYWEDDAEYAQKPQGELHGSVTVLPTQSGMDEMLATIVEYTCDDDAKNPEMLIIEQGEVGTITIEYDEEEDEVMTNETESGAERRGGYIEFYIGATISNAEVTVMAVSE